MTRWIFSVILLSFCFACSKKTTAPAVFNPPAGLPQSSTDSIKTYLALGDSYTIGQSVTLQERFPEQTVSLVRQQGKKIADPVYIAQTGWTTANLQQALSTQNPASSFDIVSLLIGVNDQYQRLDTGGYAVRFTQLLEKAIQLARGNKMNVFVLSIPDYSVTPFVNPADKLKVSMEIDWFNTINKRITEAYGINYTDITPSTRHAAVDRSLIASDNLHPSGLEYKKWAQMLAPKIASAIK